MGLWLLSGVVGIWKGGIGVCLKEVVFYGLGGIEREDEWFGSWDLG